MKVLLDTHAVVWAVDDPSRLTKRATNILLEPSNELLVSAGTIWELSIKNGLGKLSLSQPFRSWMLAAIADLGITVLPITVDVTALQATLPNHHRDPFDRLLAAHALLDNMPFVSADPVFDRYGLARIW